MSNARAGFTAVFAAALLAASCGGGSSMSPTSGTSTASSTAPSSGSPDVLITIAGMSFTPNPAAVKAGQTVAWKNNDTIAHTATEDAGVFDTGMIPAGGTSQTITIKTAATLSYHCSVHPAMVASLSGAASSPGPGY